MSAWTNDRRMGDHAARRSMVTVTNTTTGQIAAVGTLTAWRPRRRHVGEYGRITYQGHRHVARVAVDGTPRTYKLTRYDIEVQP